MSSSSIASRIATLRLRQILDSRGRPTVEADVTLEDGSFGRGAAPAGASKSRHEAHERRDGESEYYEGYGVRHAVAMAARELPSRLHEISALDQRRVDDLLREIDGTSKLERLGANTILAVSLATARAAAAHARQPLYRYLNSLIPNALPSLPMPMTNILSGGAHAERGMDFQDFLVIPIGASSYSQALEWVARVRAAAARLMAEKGLQTLLADEGGLSPGFATAEQALWLITRAIESSRLRPGEDVALAMDVAASELYDAQARTYRLECAGRVLSPTEMLAHVLQLCQIFPVVSVEDPLDEDDWEHWRALTAACVSKPLQIIGDDLFATNTARLLRGIEQSTANAVLIKVNQNGTLSGTLDVINRARQAGYATVISARSGETEDSFIADLAVATGAGQIKIGSVRNAERQAKYNQLLRIEEDLTLPFCASRRSA